MQNNDVYSITKKDCSRAGQVFYDAFAEDPVWKAVFEGEENLALKMSSFFEVPVRLGIKYGCSIASSPDLDGIAVWLPGEKADMTFMRLIVSGGFGAMFKVGSNVGKKVSLVTAELPEHRKKAMGTTPHYYLFVLGVKKEKQGKGIGGKLLRTLIAQAEKEKRSIYLETETEENVKMYEHFGFSVVRKITLPVIDVPMWEMVRHSNT